VPVNEKQTSGEVLYQRIQYAKPGISRTYWDYKDNRIISMIGEDDQRIVDMGCGEGILLEKLVQRFPNRQLLGVDVMEENISICRQFNLPVMQNDVYQSSLATESQDVVIFMEVIEHLTQPEKAIAEIHRVLRPGGKLIMVFPNDGFFKLARLLMFRLKEARYDPGHVRQWTHGDLKTMLSQMGFDFRHARFIPFFLWPISLHGIVMATKKSD